MTIVDFENSRPILGVLDKGERGRKYALILRRLLPDQIQGIRDELDQMISTGTIFTSSWMPGSDWTDTPFEPLYVRAALRDHQMSALMFGLMFWEAFDRHEEIWYTGRFEKDGVPINGRTYFQPQR